MSDYLLPDVGEGLTEAEIVTWKVQVGDEIKINDIVVEIETAKSLVELPSPYAGVVEALLVEEGMTVEVGTPIIRINDGVASPVVEPGSPVVEPGSPVGEPAETLDLSNPAATGRVEGESLVGRNKAERGAVRRKRLAASATTVAAPSVVEPVETPASRAHTPVHVLAKPPVRKLARDLGVDLTTCRATGPGGSVSRSDVEAAVGVAAQDVPTGSTTGGRSTSGGPTATGDREYREPIKGVRKMMGAAMVASAFTAPHVTEWVTLDVTRTSQFVERLRGRREFADIKVSPLLILAAACIRAMRRTPVINSTWDDAAQEVVFKSYVNLGIAAATPRGLVVPNIKDADSLSLLELAGALGDLTTVAREGKTQPAEMAGGTFTITNVGVFGIDGGTPIINPGESAILCFGATKRQPWVVTDGDGNESIEVRDVCTLTLSFDHRHVDGESGSRFLADVASMMEDPAAALLF
ncbi:2-oxoisovalerate dehydrogenase E2 component (dihydrolipoyl transacylase) [Marmoricola sp. OAE513]|uniref:dihydrolipoamide acetyltransferase family protein n=1 Tax=Marmoricola sp. OAE513 TaxID=2817894 RepID=UPI001AE6EF37